MTGSNDIKHQCDQCNHRDGSEDTDRYWVWPEVPETDYSSVTALQPWEDMSRIGIIDNLTW